MCDFPSWKIDKNGKAWWLTDKDVERCIEDGKFKRWEDAIGHSAIEKVYGVEGTRLQGPDGLPDGFKADIKSGRCNQMIMADPWGGPPDT